MANTNWWASVVLPLPGAPAMILKENSGAAAHDFVEAWHPGRQFSYCHFILWLHAFLLPGIGIVQGCLRPRILHSRNVNPSPMKVKSSPSNWAMRMTPPSLALLVAFRFKSLSPCKVPSAVTCTALSGGSARPAPEREKRATENRQLQRVRIEAGAAFHRRETPQTPLVGGLARNGFVSKKSSSQISVLLVEASFRSLVS